MGDLSICSSGHSDPRLRTSVGATDVPNNFKAQSNISKVSSYRRGFVSAAQRGDCCLLPTFHGGNVGRNGSFWLGIFNLRKSLIKGFILSTIGVIGYAYAKHRELENPRPDARSLVFEPDEKRTDD